MSEIWNKSIRFLLVDDLSNIFISQIILFTFNQLPTRQTYSTYSHLRKNHDLLSLQRRNPVDTRFWSRLCYYYSKKSRPKYNNRLTRNTPSCLEIAVVTKAKPFEQSSSASANYSQPRGNNGDERRSTVQLLDNHLSRVPTSTQNQEETMEMTDKKLSSVGAQDLDTSSVQVSNPEDTEFSWEDPAVNMNSVYRPGIDTPFSPSVSYDFQMGTTAANPILVDDGADKENSAPTTTKPESERPTEPPDY